MIATQDIAEHAVHYLNKLDFQGQQVVDLLGAAHYSQQDAAKIIGEAIGQPDLQYIEFPKDQAKQGMMQAGMSESLAGLYIEMSTNDPGKVLAGTERTKENTTRTDLEPFAQQFAQALQHA
jgi:nucleoside-diphosphate-sugar epimerase